MKTIGLIGGTTWLSTIEYYRLLNQKVQQRLGGAHSAKIILHSVEFDEVSRLQKEDRWDDLAAMYVGIARNLEMVGAECLLLGANTMHRFAETIEAAIGIPLIHIGEATALEIRKRSLRRIGLLGTRYTMEFDFLKKKLASHGIETMIPDDDERVMIHSSIHNEFAKGIFRDETKQEFKRIIQNLVGRGAEGIVLGCTEIPLLIRQEDSPVPVFDTTDIHAEAAIGFALASQLTNSE